MESNYSKWSLLILKTIEITISVMIILILIAGLIIQNYYPEFIQGKEILVSNENIKDQSVIGIPTRLEIPRLNINASLESVGLTSKGAVEVPKSSINAAWYNLSPRPGEIGNSIIDGHSGWKNGTQSVFDNLYKIKKGDKIYVEDEKGMINVFIVRDFKPYGPKDDVSVVFNSNDDRAHLNLITCVAAWDVKQKSLNDRFVVFSDKEI